MAAAVAKATLARRQLRGLRRRTRPSQKAGRREGRGRGGKGLAKAEADLKQPLTHGLRATRVDNGYPETSTGRRLALARWIADKRQPADRPRGHQPHLAAAFRPGHRAERVRFRPQRPAAVPSRPARLAGRRVHGARLEHEADAPADRHQQRLPHGFDARRRQRRPSTATTAISGAWPPRRLEAEVVRDCVLLRGRQARPDDGRARTSTTRSA